VHRVGGSGKYGAIEHRLRLSIDLIDEQPNVSRDWSLAFWIRVGIGADHQIERAAALERRVGDSAGVAQKVRIVGAEGREKTASCDGDSGGGHIGFAVPADLG